MKKSVIVIALLTAFILLTAGKLGYVNSNRIFNSYKGIGDINTKIDKELEQWRKEVTRMQNEIDDLEIKYKDQEPMLSEEAKVRKRDEINSKKEQINQFIESIWGENGKAVQINKQLLKPVVEKISAVLQKIAEEEQYDMILDVADGNIMYAVPSLDLTQRVIDELNKEFFLPSDSLRTYIVYDFVAEDKETRTAQYHIKLAAQIYSGIKKDGKLEPVNVRDVNALLSSKGITNIEDLTYENAMNFGSELDADYAIMGSLSMSGNKVSIKVDVIDINKRDMKKTINKEASGDIEFNSAVSAIVTELQVLLTQ